MTAALEGGEWSAARPAHALPMGKTRYPFYRRLGGPQGRSGRAKNLVPTRIRSRTVQPVAQSLYRLSDPAQSLSLYTHTHTHTCVYTHTNTQISDCVETAYELPLLPNKTTNEKFLLTSAALRSVDWIFIILTPA